MEQLAAHIDNRWRLSTDSSTRVRRDSGSQTVAGTRAQGEVSCGGGPEATISAVSWQHGRATGRAAGDDYRPGQETSNQIRQHWDARNGTAMVWKAEETRRRELRTCCSVGPLVFTKAAGRLGPLSGAVTPCAGHRPGPRAPDTSIDAGYLTFSARSNGLPQLPPFL